MAKVSPAEYIRQVRQEASKVTWGTRKEVMTSTAVVLVLVFVFALFFLLVDSVIMGIVKAILGLGA